MTARRGVSLNGQPLTSAQLQKLLRRGKGGSLRDLTPGGKPKAAAPRVRRPPPVYGPGTHDLHPTAEVIVRGEPVAVLIFDRVPSLNDYDQAARSNPYTGDAFAKRWQSAAHAAVEVWLTEQGLPAEYCTRADGTPGLKLSQYVLSHTRAGLVWRIYSRTRQKADRPLNLTIKPLCDGITHAGFWPDDDDKHVPLTLHQYCGVDRQRPRVELSIYALA